MSADHASFHFEVDADDVERAKRFYELVFGWTIRPWGPPDYYLIDTGQPRCSGDIRQRDPGKAADGRNGFVCTFGVEDLKAAAAAIRACGGRVDTKEIRIDGVGHLMYFRDTEGNRFGVIQRGDAAGG